ncbi:MAG: sulfur carrier protein ThiS [Acidobacteria bacterium]|nr:sulfur carrier protein ThiS [Acidobacteriota bacterium]
MQVTVNGDVTSVADSISVAELLQWLELKKERIAVELNRDLVPRKRWEETHLRPGDCLEIVHFVGGG